MTHLLHCPQMAGLAGRISDKRPDVQLGPVSWKAFQDALPGLVVEDAKSLRNRDMAFLASPDEPAEIFRPLALVFEIPRLVVRSLTLVLPFFPVGSMERVDREGQAATASRRARMIRRTPFSLGGPTQIIIFDTHARQERLGGHGPACPVSMTAA